MRRYKWLILGLGLAVALTTVGIVNLDALGVFGVIVLVVIMPIAGIGIVVKLVKYFWQH